MSEAKLSKQKQKERRRKTEEQMAEEMPWENIISKIASLKKEREVAQQDITEVTKKWRTVDSEVSKYQRILMYKKRHAGA